MGSRHLVELGFVNHFNGHFFASEHVTRQFDDGKMARAERLLQVVETGNFAIVNADPMTAMVVAGICVIVAGAAKCVHISSLKKGQYLFYNLQIY